MTNSIPHTTCPYLGLDIDRTVMLGEPTPDHRCYRQSPPAQPDNACQSGFCLSGHHVNCSIYQRVPSPAGASGSSPGVSPKSPPKSPRTRTPLPQGEVRRRRWPFLVTLGSIGLVLCLILVTIVINQLGLVPPTIWGMQNDALANVSAASPATSASSTGELSTDAMSATPVAMEMSQGTIVTPTITATPTPMPAPMSLATTALAADSSGVRFATPTAEPGGQVFLLGPSVGNAGWFKSEDSQRNHLGDSYLYAGTYGSETFISAVRFNLARVPRGAPIREARLRLTGLRQDQFQSDAQGVWLVQLVPQTSLDLMGPADFLTMLSAPAALTLFPPLNAADLALERVNEWEFDATARQWLEKQLLDGATSVIVRVQTSIAEGEALFAWDSGLGSETQGNGPALVVSLGPPPPTPPPLPTKQVIVATLTPVPENVLTVVAIAKTATAVAFTTGTYTPVPYAIVTPTPFPANLETVQAVTFAQQLPAVILHTPTPNSPLMATRNAEYATAVALTTGTFTPVPSAFVTPMLILPSPPPENVATEAARVVAATAFAESGAATPTPLPYNGVIAEYIYATAVRENQETAVADAVIATASAKVNGTATPLPWNAIVITAVPPPTETSLPTATPTRLIEPIAGFTPTATPEGPVVVPDTLPGDLRNKIIFKTNRVGKEEIYALDPANGEIYRINEAWVYPLAQRQLGISPDGLRQAVVQPASNGVLQIHLRTFDSNAMRQITALNGVGSGGNVISYDPDWSPRGDLIVFVSTNSGNDEIYTVTVDGSILTQLTNNTFEWDKHPSWSPDGNQIVFFSNRDTGRRQLWIMNADGAGQRNLSSNEYEDWDPIWIR